MISNIAITGLTLLLAIFIPLFVCLYILGR